MTDSFYNSSNQGPSLEEVLEGLMYKKSRKVTKLIRKMSECGLFFKVNVDSLFKELKMRQADRTLNRLKCIIRDYNLNNN
jgi:hypothetical protein